MTETITQTERIFDSATVVWTDEHNTDVRREYVHRDGDDDVTVNKYDDGAAVGVTSTSVRDMRQRLDGEVSLQ